jgi:hypothetical protein
LVLISEIKFGVSKEERKEEIVEIAFFQVE